MIRQTEEASQKSTKVMSLLRIYKLKNQPNLIQLMNPAFPSNYLHERNRNSFIL